RSRDGICDSVAFERNDYTTLSSDGAYIVSCSVGGQDDILFTIVIRDNKLQISKTPLSGCLGTPKVMKFNAQSTLFAVGSDAADDNLIVWDVKNTKKY